MSVDDKYTMLFTSYPLGMLIGFIISTGIEWYKKKQRKTDDCLTAIGVYDEKPID